ncbi:MAG: hypothetical protein R3F60_03390 [bacterium]
MYRWVTLLVWAQCACIPTQDAAEGDAARPDAARPDAADAMDVADVADVADAAGGDAGSVDAGLAPDVAGPDPGPVDGRCPGTYVVTAWTLDIPSFGGFAINDATERNLAEGDLVLDLIVGDAEPMVLARDTVIAPDGARGPDPAVPPGVPMGVAPGGDGFWTVEPGEVRVIVGPFRLRPGDGEFYAPAVDFHLVLAELSGAFGADCATFEGHLDGAFADRPGFSIPGRRDADSDGDGTLDGWQVFSTLTAVRVDD